MTIETTDQLRRSARALPEPVRKVLQDKLLLLRDNPAHPSLCVHKMKREEGL